MIIKDKLKLYGDVLKNQYMKFHTTFRIGGNVSYVFYPFSAQDLLDATIYLNSVNMPFKIVGKGSNILWCDDDLDMVVIFLDHYMHHYYLENDIIECDCGISIIYLAHFCKENALSNLEFASGIPGTLGGCIYMNAGAYKKEMADIVEEVLVIKDNELVWLSNYDMQFAYRHSILKEHQDWIVVKVRIKVVRRDIDEISELMDSRRQRRLETQPLDKPSAGSTFQNPATIPAWKCIEDCGLRGYTIGGAMVSEKHCNFIINQNEATYNDVIALIDYIKTKVKMTMDIDLITEVEQFTWQSLKRK